MSTQILAQLEHEISADTKLVVSHGTWRKQDYFDIRTYWRSPGGEWFPTKKGVRLTSELAHRLHADIQGMLDFPTPPENGQRPASNNGGDPIGERGAVPDLSVLAFLRIVAEHIHLGRKQEDIRYFAAQMGGRFQRPDAPYTAIFSPLMRDLIEAEIARIRSAKKARRAAQRPQMGVFCWDMVNLATSQHPDHVHGASYCKKCQPYSLDRIEAIAERAQVCIDKGISRDPLPEETFAWVRLELAKTRKKIAEAQSRYGSKTYQTTGKEAQS